MVSFLIKLVSIALLLACPAYAVYVPAVATMTFGGRVLLIDSHFVTLATGSSGANEYSTLRNPDGTNHQVSGTLHIYGCTETGIPGTNYTIHVLYGDTAVGLSSGSGPTTPIWYGNVASTSILPIDEQAGNTENSRNHAVGIAIDFTVPNGKYPHIFNDTGANGAICYGSEQ